MSDHEDREPIVERTNQIMAMLDRDMALYDRVAKALGFETHPDATVDPMELLVVRGAAMGIAEAELTMGVKHDASNLPQAFARQRQMDTAILQLDQPGVIRH